MGLAIHSKAQMSQHLLPASRPHHPDTSPFPPRPTPRYPLPMEHANKALNQHIATPSEPPGSAPASSTSTTTYGSAPNSRGVVSHRRKNWDKDFVAKTNTPATTTPPKQPPATPAPQSNLPPFAQSLSKGPPPASRQRAATTCKGSGRVKREVKQSEEGRPVDRIETPGQPAPTPPRPTSAASPSRTPAGVPPSVAPAPR